ncbi:MAG: hypothetical protein HY719_07815 [Planctomycetes bacterium]|nr:hypothetical protein [Planctomycetota bacterium]
MSDDSANPSGPRAAGIPAPPPPPTPGRLPGETTAQVNSRTWDLALNLGHPALIYVVIEVFIFSRLTEGPALRAMSHPWLVGAALFGVVFFGAWAVFYSTLLRDMGHQSRAAALMVAWGALGVAAQFVLFPEPAAVTATPLFAFLGAHLAPILPCWAVVMIRWRRARRRFEAEIAARAATPS